MPTDATETLPDHDEIMRRLRSVDDEPNMNQRFYPLIAKKAGATLNGRGIALTMRLAVATYVGGGMPPMMAGLLERLLPAWVEALVDDAAVRTDTLAALAESRPA
ncbi:hypothetical protein ACFYZ9_33780 [Streptomyces sp. NPDC001691]|uniref:hypothetical protein n=1 Tax=Streptomyces sp. NPDC001691 TaxID=3364600 RepID=UPI0036BB29A9